MRVERENGERWEPFKKTGGEFVIIADEEEARDYRQRVVEWLKKERLDIEV